jgi:hypothetical protein
MSQSAEYQAEADAEAAVARLDPKKIRASARGTHAPHAMPAQKPGRSKQDFGTPPEFIAAVKLRFKIKEFYYDLAADETNTKGRYHFCKEEDSLAQDWTKHDDKQLWLNPEFGDIARYAQKCAVFASATAQPNNPTKARAAGMRFGGAIYFLTPASVGTHWFVDHVWGVARVIALQGRLSFDGKNPYPKECMLSVFGLSPGFEVWDWRKEKGPAATPPPPVAVFTKKGSTS